MREVEYFIKIKMLDKHLNIRVEFLVYLLLSATIIEELMRAFFQMIGINDMYSSFIDILIYLLIGVVFILKKGFNVSEKRLFIQFRMIKTLALICVMYVTFVISIAINPLIDQVFHSDFFRILLICFVFFFVAQYEIDYKYAVNLFSMNIYISVVYALLEMLILKIPSLYMTISYNILPWTIVSYILFVQTKKNRYLVALILLLALILIGGARMPFLCVFIFIILENIMKVDRIEKERIMAYIICLVGGISIYLMFDPIINLASKIFPNSRTISMLLNGVATNTSSRDNISNFLLSRIREHMFMFRGVYSDRIATGDSFVNTSTLGFWISPENKYFIYAHNLFLEWFYDFGVIIGGCVSVTFIALIIRIIFLAKKSKNMYFLDYSLLIIIIGFVPLLVSNSYLSYTYFWYLLGYGMSIEYHYKWTRVDRINEFV